MRLDTLLVQNGYFTSREKAKDAIQAGLVTVDEKKAGKPSEDCDEGCKIAINKEGLMPYVSRGGLKLKKAIDEFRLDFAGKTILDLGASTGGFTDCALQHGARFVYSIDVGTDQLDASMLNHKQVKSIENIHVKDLIPEHLNHEKADFIVADLSFISLRLVFQYLPPFLKPDGNVVALIKPQFEAGREALNKSGVLKSPKIHKKVLSDVVKAASDSGLFLIKLTSSPLIERNKNIEYLGLFSTVKRPFYNVELVIDQAFTIQKEQ